MTDLLYWILSCIFNKIITEIEIQESYVDGKLYKVLYDPVCWIGGRRMDIRSAIWYNLYHHRSMVKLHNRILPIYYTEDEAREVINSFLEEYEKCKGTYTKTHYKKYP